MMSELRESDLGSVLVAPLDELLAHSVSRDHQILRLMPLMTGLTTRGPSSIMLTPATSWMALITDWPRWPVHLAALDDADRRRTVERRRRRRRGCDRDGANLIGFGLSTARLKSRVVTTTCVTRLHNRPC